MFSSLEVRWIFTCAACPLAAPLLSCAAIVLVCKDDFLLYIHDLEALSPLIMSLAKRRFFWSPAEASGWLRGFSGTCSKGVRQRQAFT